MPQLKQQADSLLKIALNNNAADFRDGQWEAVENLVRERKRLLVVQRTGWGKSIIYFLSTRLLLQSCIGKIKPTKPQKEMQNSHQQAHNLDGAFQVAAWAGIKGPVLLVDDMIDSRWTMTVVTALLRQAGSGPVYPLALANTAKG